LKYTWQDFSENFHQLLPVQLNYILEHYSLPTPTPRCWEPPPGTPDLSSANKLLESCENHPPLMLPRSGSRINFYSENQTLQQLLSNYKLFGLTFAFPLVGVREQPDGREKTTDSNPSCTLDIHESIEVTSLTESAEIRVGAEVASRGGKGRFVTSSSCSSVSDRTELTSNQKPKLNPVTVQEEEDSDEGIVLPVTETTTLPSKISKISTEEWKLPVANNVSISTMSLVDAASSPAEVFVVDIEIGRNGLCVGLIDGLVTVCNQQGVFVRSLLPDNSNFKSHRSRHRYVIKCNLQNGRLQVGDRILTVNGISLVNMKYSEAMKRFRKAGEKLRLLVARCAADVSLKVTSTTF